MGLLKTMVTTTEGDAWSPAGPAWHQPGTGLWVPVSRTGPAGHQPATARRLLEPQDFELLVDLVFSTSGWRRVGVVGGTQKTLTPSIT